MSYARQILEAHSESAIVDPDLLARSIEACFECAQACTACADACLGEQDSRALTRCIRLNLDCADLCDATGRILSRQAVLEDVARAAIAACFEACDQCAEECDHHTSRHEHCRMCAEACRRCEKACNDLLSAMGPP